MLADCIANAGLVVGSEILAWRRQDLRARAGRLVVDGKPYVEGKSVDPLAALQLLPPAMTSRGKSLAAGQIIITGSLIGMNWLTGNRQLKGIIDGLGEVAIRLAAA
jgi:2-keto-4-pentenoate hydratase